MKIQPADQVPQIDTIDPVATAHPYDYADAFEVRLPRPDPHSPEKWGRAGLESTSSSTCRWCVLSWWDAGSSRHPGRSRPFSTTNGLCSPD